MLARRMAETAQAAGRPNDAEERLAEAQAAHDHAKALRGMTVYAPPETTS